MIYGLPIKPAPHIHYWVRPPKIAKYKHWICKDPDCYACIDSGYLIGKRAVCPVCGNPFIVVKEPTLSKELTCSRCEGSLIHSRHRKARQLAESAVTVPEAPIPDEIKKEHLEMAADIILEYKEATKEIPEVEDLDPDKSRSEIIRLLKQKGIV